MTTKELGVCLAERYPISLYMLAQAVFVILDTASGETTVCASSPCRGRTAGDQSLSAWGGERGTTPGPTAAGAARSTSQHRD
jgi:hypothetical protein